MRRAIIHNPEDAMCAFIGFLSHNGIHQLLEGFDACLVLNDTKDLA